MKEKLYYNIMDYNEFSINGKTYNNNGKYYKNFYNMLKEIETKIKKYEEKENYILYSNLEIEISKNYLTYEIIIFKKGKYNNYIMKKFILPIYIKTNEKSINFYYQLINKFIFNKRKIIFNISTAENNKINYKGKYNNTKFINEYNLKSLINENEIYNKIEIKKNKYYIFIKLKQETEEFLITINKKYLYLLNGLKKENNYIKVNNEKFYLTDLLYN